MLIAFAAIGNSLIIGADSFEDAFACWWTFRTKKVALVYLHRFISFCSPQNLKQLLSCLETCISRNNNWIFAVRVIGPYRIWKLFLSLHAVNQVRLVVCHSDILLYILMQHCKHGRFCQLFWAQHWIVRQILFFLKDAFDFWFIQYFQESFVNICIYWLWLQTFKVWVSWILRFND